MLGVLGVQWGWEWRRGLRLDTRGPSWLGAHPIGANPQRPFVHHILPRVNRWVVSGALDFGDTASTMTLQGYAEPTTAFAETKAADFITAADLTAINANGLYAFREVPALPALTASGYDA